MDMNKVPVGKNPPWDINVVIEVPIGSDPIKYEMDKDSGAIFVDRFLHTAMHYPCNYGFIPHTLAGDGDPADVMVVGRRPLMPGCVIPARPIGVLKMEDDGGQDEKILAVPCTRLHPFYHNVDSYQDLPEIMTQQIEHFFKHYKDLEKNKWVNILGWADKNSAAQLIEESIEQFQKQEQSSAA
jgi:inorganic pyrophosphatase